MVKNLLMKILYLNITNQDFCQWPMLAKIRMVRNFSLQLLLHHGSMANM